MLHDNTLDRMDWRNPCKNAMWYFPNFQMCTIYLRLIIFFFWGGGDILLTFSLQFSLYLAEIKLNIMLSAKNIYLPGGFFGNTSWSRITKQCVSFIKQWRNFTSNSCPYLWLACSSELESGLKMLHVFSQPVTFTLESPSPVSPAQCCRISVVAYSNSC